MTAYGLSVNDLIYLYHANAMQTIVSFRLDIDFRLLPAVMERSGDAARIRSVRASRESRHSRSESPRGASSENSASDVPAMNAASNAGRNLHREENKCELITNVYINNIKYGSGRGRSRVAELGRRGSPGARRFAMTARAGPAGPGRPGGMSGRSGRPASTKGAGTPTALEALTSPCWTVRAHGLDGPAAITQVPVARARQLGRRSTPDARVAPGHRRGGALCLSVAGAGVGAG